MLSNSTRCCERSHMPQLADCAPPGTALGPCRVMAAWNVFARPTWHTGWSGILTPTVFLCLERPVWKSRHCFGRLLEAAKMNVYCVRNTRGGMVSEEGGGGGGGGGGEGKTGWMRDTYTSGDLGNQTGAQTCMTSRDRQPCSEQGSPVLGDTASQHGRCRTGRGRWF